MKRAFFLLALIATPAFAAWHVERHIRIGGKGGWDYITVDSESRRAFVSHSDRVDVVDVDSGKVVKTIYDTPGVHGIALAPSEGRGFISCGRDQTMIVFSLKTLTPIVVVKATGANPDAILYDDATKRVFTFNGGGKNVTAYDTGGKVLGTIAVDAKPEFAVSDGAGRVFVNLEDKSEIAVIDAKKLEVVAHWPLAPGETPTGLAIDRAHHRLFSGCENQKMVIVDSTNGKVLGAPAIGEGVDATAYDDGMDLAFSSNGRSGTLTIVKGLDSVENVDTAKGARTMALDKKTHHIFLPAAKYGPPAQGSTRPSVEPDTFELVEVAP